MKIGLILLTADPVHCGHISMAAKCLNEELVDKILFVVAKQNPWKSEPIATFEERCEMIQNACQFIPNCELEDIEKDLFPPHYSCFTLDALYKKYDGEHNELFIVSGADCINGMPKWLHYNDMIKGRFKVLGFTREGKAPETDEVEYQLIESDFPDLSSTYIRQLASEGKNLYPYIPESNLEMCQRIYGDVERQTEFYV